MTEAEIRYQINCYEVKIHECQLIIKKQEDYYEDLRMLDKKISNEGEALSDSTNRRQTALQNLRSIQYRPNAVEQFTAAIGDLTRELSMSAKGGLVAMSALAANEKRKIKYKIADEENKIRSNSGSIDYLYSQLYALAAEESP